MIKNLIHRLLKEFYPLFRNFFPYQVYAYLTVGAINTGLNIGLFYLFFLTFKKSFLAVEIATVISFIISVLTGFWLSKNFAFTEASTEKKETQKQFGKYVLVSAQGQFSDYLITKGLIVFISIQPMVAYVFSTVIMLILNYLLQKYFTFKANTHATSL